MNLFHCGGKDSQELEPRPHLVLVRQHLVGGPDHAPLLFSLARVQEHLCPHADGKLLQKVPLRDRSVAQSVAVGRPTLPDV